MGEDRTSFTLELAGGYVMIVAIRWKFQCVFTIRNYLTARSLATGLTVSCLLELVGIG